MLDAKLNPCASLLYHWILRRIETGAKLQVDLQDFQAWTSEYREKPYSDREIFEALIQLKERELVRVAKTEVTLALVSDAHSPLKARSTADLLLEEQETFKQQASDRPNPFLLISLVTLTSFVLGLTPLIMGLTFSRTQDLSLATLTPWSVLAEKNIN